METLDPKEEEILFVLQELFQSNVPNGNDETRDVADRNEVGKQEINTIAVENREILDLVDLDFGSIDSILPSTSLEPLEIHDDVVLDTIAGTVSETNKNTQKKHDENKLFCCTECGKSFTQQAHLQIHFRKHTGERPFQCSFPGCFKSFTQLGNLKTHERKHTGEKPFKCSFCFKEFSQMGNMKTHEQLHLGIKPHPCPIPGCGKSFTQLGNLKVFFFTDLVASNQGTF
jgi:hypothetical protein